MALVVVSGFERGGASVRLVQNFGRLEDAGRGAVAGEPRATGAARCRGAGAAQAPARPSPREPEGDGVRRTGAARGGSPRRNDRKRLPATELRRLEQQAEPERANRQEPFTRRRYCRALVPRQASDTVI